MMRLKTKFSAGALSLALGAVLCWPAPVRAEEDVPLDTRVFRGIMESIGLRRDGDQVITYTERAPLVIPSAKVLPPPEKFDAVIAKNPAWPVDPEVKRAKQEAALERANKLNADEQLLHDQRPLRPDEMTPGPKPRAERRANPDAIQQPVNGSGNPLPPSELGSKNGIFGILFKKDDPDVARFTGEPPRASLTAPPRGYQTPSPDQPYGVGVEKPKGSTTQEYVTDHPVGKQ